MVRTSRETAQAQQEAFALGVAELARPDLATTILPESEVDLQKVDEALAVIAAQSVFERHMIGKINLVEDEVWVVNIRQPISLQIWAVVIVEIINADDMIPTGEQLARQLRTDKSGHPSNNNGHD